MFLIELESDSKWITPFLENLTARKQADDALCEPTDERSDLRGGARDLRDRAEVLERPEANRVEIFQ